MTDKFNIVEAIQTLVLDNLHFMIKVDILCVVLLCLSLLSSLSIKIWTIFSFSPKIINDATLLPPTDEDGDVTQERRRVMRGSGRYDLLQLRNLSKVCNGGSSV